MLEQMEGPQARTTARGNLFSFSLPWEDIEDQCILAEKEWKKATEASENSILLPHNEEVLATLVHVHVIGMNKDIDAVTGATIRTRVVLSLINELRKADIMDTRLYGIPKRTWKDACKSCMASTAMGLSFPIKCGRRRKKLCEKR